ncbi:MAG: dTDP-4-dehydrorhamnose reductase, partial [Eudoraea sp.]|nr:dTDP-4-dehydrorhamnose reductase [Eudoraea sp.]
MEAEGKKILILGGSGFIGNAIYKELCNYYDTSGTYFSSKNGYRDNQQFLQYNMQEDDVFQLLEKVKPSVIISALRGDFASQIQAHQHIIEYVS